MKAICYSKKDFEWSIIEKANSGKHEITFADASLTAASAQLAQDHEAVLLFAGDDASAPVIEKLHKLGVKYIALRSAGYDNVSLEKTHELGIRVANVPAYSPYAIAEHSVMLMLALNRKLVSAHARVQLMNFSLNGLVGYDMNGKTVGIIGTGRIGSVTVKILHGFGCRLLCYDINKNEELVNKYEVEYTSLDDLLTRSDIVSLYTPLNPSTHHLIDKDRIGKMKNGAMLINTSRGGVVDTVALIDALKSRKIGSAGLDVYEKEKGLFFYDRSGEVLQDDMLARLMSFNNVIITPHQAFLTHEALGNIADTTIYNLDCWAAGKHSENEL
jgi:D-lactate dehydrogenase